MDGPRRRFLKSRKKKKSSHDVSGKHQKTPWDPPRHTHDVSSIHIMAVLCHTRTIKYIHNLWNYRIQIDSRPS